jgi:hypothetical protein
MATSDTRAVLPIPGLSDLSGPIHMNHTTRWIDIGLHKIVLAAIRCICAKRDLHNTFAIKVHRCLCRHPRYVARKPGADISCIV